MACRPYNTGRCLQLRLFNCPNFGVHFKLGTSFCKTKYNCFLLNIIIRNRYSYNIIKEMSKVNGCVNLEWNIGQRNMLNSVKCFVCNLSRFVLIAKQKPTIIILLHMIGVESWCQFLPFIRLIKYNKRCMIDSCIDCWYILISLFQNFISLNRCCSCLMRSIKAS